MKINSKTKYNNFPIPECNTGDKVKLVSIDEAIERAERSEDLRVSATSVVVLEIVEKDNNEISKVISRAGVMSSTMYNEYYSNDTRFIVERNDSSDTRMFSCKLRELSKKGGWHNIWMHPVFLEKI